MEEFRATRFRELVTALPGVKPAVWVSRHARACPGHPPSFRLAPKDVDTRDKPGHDEWRGRRPQNISNSLTP
jgi:hypothetical protein